MEIADVALLAGVPPVITCTTNEPTPATGDVLVVALGADTRFQSSDLTLLRMLDEAVPDRLAIRVPAGSAPLEVVDAADETFAFAVTTPQSPAEALDVGANLTKALPIDAKVLVTAAKDWDTEIASQFVAGLCLGVDQRHPTPHSPGPLTLQLADGEAIAAAQYAIALAEGVRLARRLANMPSNVKSPQWLAEQALSLADEHTSVEVVPLSQLAELGFGGVVSVSAGSVRPGNVTVLRRGPQDQPPKVLVGKGITFDSGGLSIKPAAGMPVMKTDMSGAAAVLGTFATLSALKADAPVVGLIACAENMPGASATRPGDVITHFGGRTTEVLNTDAEGRLVLADLLAFADASLQPSAIVDIATLTGSATVGLGRSHAALYCDDLNLLQELTRASEATDDKLWRLPLLADYAHALDSDVADAANVNTDPHINAGSITAALFLAPFAGNTPWAHLDIAGVGRRESGKPGRPKGATGYGVALFVNWVTQDS